MCVDWGLLPRPSRYGCRTTIAWWFKFAWCRALNHCPPYLLKALNRWTTDSKISSEGVRVGLASFSRLLISRLSDPNRSVMLLDGYAVLTSCVLPRQPVSPQRAVHSLCRTRPQVGAGINRSEARIVLSPCS